jgi:hypothetical protein
MISYGKFVAVFFLSFSALAAAKGYTQQSDGAVADIQKQLLSLYQPAKATADGTDIVTAGAVLVLQKDHLVMTKVDQAVPTTNIYKNGTIAQDGLAKVVGFLNRLQHASQSGQDAAVTTREFVTGEKFWVTAIVTKPEGVTFALMSDPINDQRYKATLKFPFARGMVLSPDDTAALVAEVIKIDGPEGSPDQGNAQQGAAGQAAKAPADTKTIALGQTRDQVVATFGVPTKVVKLGAKEIDFFPDMKVTFQHDKVTNVE